MKKAIALNSKHTEHSKKDCVCGGHSKHDVAKNKHHNSTKMRLNIRKVRAYLNNGGFVFE